MSARIVPQIRHNSVKLNPNPNYHEEGTLSWLSGENVEEKHEITHGRLNFVSHLVCDLFQHIPESDKRTLKQSKV